MKSPPSLSPWPEEALEKYEPVRVLGKGAFASVVLAQRKSTSKDEDNHLVAMKQVKSATDTQENYLHREIYILRELSHPNIMKLVDSWEPTPENNHALMALTYAQGRTLEYILSHIGAPSLIFGRVVISQLVDAVAYLHSHAVIHRDIKPDNMIIKNADLQDPALLIDVIDSADVSWADERRKWHLTLVDFGFARALRPQDIEAEKEFKRKASSAHLDELEQPSKDFLSLSSSSRKGKMRVSATDDSLDQALNDSSSKLKEHIESLQTKEKNDITKQGRAAEKKDVNVSRHYVRGMSALGHRDYAAPEIKYKVREEKRKGNALDLNIYSTLSPFVSDYGMVADAFSVGSTARYVLTGVPPHENVEEVVANYYSPWAKGIRWITKKLKKKGTTVLTKKRYRATRQIPIEAIRLVKGMTQPNPSKRTTVRDARMHPFIDDLFDHKDGAYKKEIAFLKCSQM